MAKHLRAHSKKMLGSPIVVMKIFEYGMKPWKGRWKSLGEIVTVNKKQHCFILEKGTIDAVFALKRCNNSIVLKKKVIYMICRPGKFLLTVFKRKHWSMQ